MLKSRNSACFSAGTKLSGLSRTGLDPSAIIDLSIMQHKTHVFKEGQMTFSTTSSVTITMVKGVRKSTG